MNTAPESTRRALALSLATLLAIFGSIGAAPRDGAAAALVDWARRYNGPAGAADEAAAIAVDLTGNVYVTGRSFGTGTSYDYLTVKYDASGNRLWAARYNGTGNANDEPHAIVVDGAGGVVVTGESSGNGISVDYVTIKYRADGQRLWLRRYNGPGNNSNDYARALAVDKDNNVYVTGSAKFAVTGNDFLTIKYDSGGNRQWVRRYSGPESGSNDGANAIALDASANVYVTGRITGATGPDDIFDYATIKYDTDGNRQWARRYNGPGNNYDEPSAVAVDGSGNVYVTGQSLGVDSNYDYATIKYSALGERLWTRRYNGTGDHADNPRDIAVDHSGNVYVTGSSWGDNHTWDYATVRYDTDGRFMWAARHHTVLADHAHGVAADEKGGIYVTGYCWEATGVNYVTIKYDLDGVVLWKRRYSGPAGGADLAAAIAVDAAGGVYVTGTSASSGTGNDYATVKYRQN